MHSMVGIRRFVAEDTYGVLDPFFERVGTFDHNDLQIAEIFATHAAIALAALTLHDRDFRAISGLSEALMTRDVWPNERDADGHPPRERRRNIRDAATLRRTSQLANVKLRTIAEHVVATGELPAP